MSAKIIINKKSGIFSRAAYFTVYFDGKEVAEMVNSKTFVLEDEGVYAVQVRSKWMKSQTLIVKVNEGQEAFLLIRYGLKYFSFLYAIFLFSLAGNIFFITGKIVREIDMSELGNIHIGRNITQYAWDGRDEFGDRLANGVYLYRVVTRMNDKSIDLNQTSASKYFNHEFGKMYLFR